MNGPMSNGQPMSLQRRVFRIPFYPATMLFVIFRADRQQLVCRSSHWRHWQAVRQNGSGRRVSRLDEHRHFSRLLCRFRSRIAHDVTIKFHLRAKSSASVSRHRHPPFRTARFRRNRPRSFAADVHQFGRCRIATNTLQVHQSPTSSSERFYPVPERGRRQVQRAASDEWHSLFFHRASVIGNFTD